MHKNPWIYIAANCAVAVVAVLDKVVWPDLLGASGAIYIAMVLGVVNTYAHSVTDAGPAN